MCAGLAVGGPVALYLSTAFSLEQTVQIGDNALCLVLARMAALPGLAFSACATSRAQKIKQRK